MGVGQGVKELKTSPPKKSGYKNTHLIPSYSYFDVIPLLLFVAIPFLVGKNVDTFLSDRPEEWGESAWWELSPPPPPHHGLILNRGKKFLSKCRHYSPFK